MSTSGEPRRRLVCRCLGVASHRILEAVRAGNLTSVEQVTKAVHAGSGCGTCHLEIEEILDDAAGRLVDATVRLENRLICETETRARIEGSLDGLLGPRLAKRGVTLELLGIEGLEVRLRLGGAADEEAVRYVTEKLRKYVCADLEVKATR